MIKQFFKVFAILSILGVFVSILVVGGYTYKIMSSAKMIDPTTIYKNLDNNSYIYDNKGKRISTLYLDEDRKIISIDDMPDNLLNAFVAIEDKTFYEHHGVNVKRVIGAIVEKALGKSSDISGTSTITQQLARNVYLEDIKSERSLERKITELYYSFIIEKKLSKEEILEAYLNTIYFGYQNYGISTAAKTYFSKNVKDLSLEECAALAALPQAPDTYSLLKDEKGENRSKIKGTDLFCDDTSKERRFLVLDLMAEQGYISKKSADDAKKNLKDFINPTIIKDNKKHSYFIDYTIDTVINDLMKKYGITEDSAYKMLYTGGFKIYSTLDRKAQNIIYNEFLDDYNFPWSSEKPQAAMVICENKSGKICAMVGGRKSKGKKLFNRAISPRQPGSSIKPLSVYSAALQKSYDLSRSGEKWDFVDFNYDKQGKTRWGNYITAGSVVIDEPIYYKGQIWPYNANRTFSGYRTFRTALQQSINTCAVKIQLQIGNKYSQDMLKKYGISTFKDSGNINDVNPASFALGAMSYGVTPLDMALAYSTFPNEGVRNSGICYTKVEDSNGKTILKSESVKTKVLDKGVAWIMTDVLKSVVSRGIAYNASISGVEVGGKTGTTNDQYDIWFDGFTPKYSASLWIGTDHNNRLSSMSETAAALWSKIMRQIPDVTKGEYPSKPSDVIYTRGEYYTTGTQP